MPSRSQFATKEAYNQYFRNYRAKNREKMRAYNRKYNKAWRKKFGYRNEKKWQRDNPGKEHAAAVARRAIRLGIIKKTPCVLCRKRKSVAHHPDYRRPLHVIFLCHIHHRVIHYRWRKNIFKRIREKQTQLEDTRETRTSSSRGLKQII